jgi:hypothetical protein
LFVLFCETTPGWPGTHYAAQAGLKLSIFYLRLLNAGITGGNHHNWINLFFKVKRRKGSRRKEKPFLSARLCIKSA